MLSACGPSAKSQKRIQKFKELGYSSYICQNKLDRAFFQHGSAYGDFKDLPRRRAADKALWEKAFSIAKSPR